MSWYLAPSLSELRKTLNRLYPDRDKTSDGTIGDAAHRNRKSQHNPNSRKSVNAYDIDRDLVPGNKQASDAGMAQLLDWCRNDPQERVEYIIFEGYIYSRAFGFAKRTYTGDNKHDKHMHVSIRDTVQAEQNTAPWLDNKPKEEPDVNDQQNAWLSNIENRTKNLESAYTRDINADIQPRLGRIEKKLESLSAGGVDTEAVATRVADLLAERLKS